MHSIYWCADPEFYGLTPGSTTCLFMNGKLVGIKDAVVCMHFIGLTMTGAVMQTPNALHLSGKILKTEQGTN